MNSPTQNSRASSAESARFAALLMPQDLLESVVDTGAEVVEQQHAGEATPSRSLHIFDEEERLGKLSSSGCSPAMQSVHEMQLKRLRWARATLLADGRMRQFLPSSDPHLWPEIGTLTRAVDLVRQLKEFADSPPDARGAEALAKALDVIRREHQHAGLHPLKPTPVGGSLTVYRETAHYKRPTEIAAAAAAAGVPDIPSVLESDALLRPEPAALLVDLRSARLIGPEVLRLPLTTAALSTLVTHVEGRPLQSEGTADAGVARLRESWAALVAVHRRQISAGAAGLAVDVMEARRLLGVSEVALAALMRAAATAGARVRLRVGVYATVLHRHRLFVLCFGACSTRSLSEVERHAFLKHTSRVFEEAEDAGEVMFLGSESIDALLRRRFLSPALDVEGRNGQEGCTATAWCGVTVEEPQQLSEEVSLVCVRAKRNPLLVLHGSRVQGGFEGSVEVLEALKRTRDAVAHEQTEQELRRAYLQTSEPSDSHARAAASVAITSAALTGAELRAEVGRALVSALTDGGLTREEIHAHPSMQYWRSQPHFTTLVAAALKTFAEYKGRKYQLKE